jgi:hypothetical protein
MAQLETKEGKHGLDVVPPCKLATPLGFNINRISVFNINEESCMGCIAEVTSTRIPQGLQLTFSALNGKCRFLDVQ